jgi:putative membrane protein
MHFSVGLAPSHFNADVSASVFHKSGAIMRILATLTVIIVALLHFGFLTLEMFFWDHPIGRNIFSMTPVQSAETAVLAANQGLYNGFLGTGLLWGAFARKRDVVIFFLACVIIAGVFGAVTASPTILFTQAAPAIIALILTLISKRA